MAKVAECPSSKQAALSLSPSTAKRDKYHQGKIYGVSTYEQ
jgi:hypothetical protein